MEAMKEHMTTMMEEMMSMRKMMEDNTAIVVAASIATKMDPIHPAGFNQVNRPVSDVVGQGGETVKNACGPHHVQVQRKHSFPPYRLPPNYTSPIIVYASGENCGSNAFQDYFDDAKDSSQESRVKKVSRIKESFNQSFKNQRVVQSRFKIHVKNQEKTQLR